MTRIIKTRILRGKKNKKGDAFIKGIN